MSRNGTFTYVRVPYVRIFISSHCIHGTFTSHHFLLIRILILRNGPNIVIRVIGTIILLTDIVVWVLIVITKPTMNKPIFTIFDSSDDEETESTQLIHLPAKKVVLATSSVKLQLNGKEMRLIMQYSNVYGWRGICKDMEKEMNLIFTTIKPTEEAIVQLIQRPLGEVANHVLHKSTMLQNFQVVDFTNLRGTTIDVRSAGLYFFMRKLAQYCINLVQIRTSDVNNLFFEIKGFTRFLSEIRPVKELLPKQVIDIVLAALMYNDIEVLYRFVYADIPASCYTKLLKLITLYFVNEKYQAEVMVCGQLYPTRLRFTLELTEQMETIRHSPPMVWRVTDIVVI